MNFLNPDGKKTAPAAENLSQAHLAAFGKHPGWEDHLPGIGLDTDALAHIKQQLYVAGIGSQVDSGAWEKLEPDRRLAGFDHTFLCISGSRTIVGSLWSSVDRLGRAKYPMVVCAELNGLSIATAFQCASPILKRLRLDCQASSNPEDVKSACANSLVLLRQAYDPAQRGAQMYAGESIRNAFMACEELGPERRGWMRIFHELGLADRQSKSRALPSDRQAQVARVPAPTIQNYEPMVLWGELMQASALPSETIWILQHNDEPWLDIMLGNVSGKEFFCLQASLQALPLATQVPYELPAGTKAGWGVLEAKFLETQPGMASAVPGPQSGNAIQQLKKWVWPGLTVLICLVCIIAWNIHRHHQQLAVRQTADQAAQEALQAGRVALQNGDYSQADHYARVVLGIHPDDSAGQDLLKQAAALKESQQTNLAYQQAMQAAKASLADGNYDLAGSNVDQSLSLKPEDPEATQLKQKIQQTRAYAGSLALGESAKKKGDYAEAIRQAEQSLKLFPGDAAATRLRDDSVAGQQKQAAAEEQARQLSQYQDLVSRGRAAMAATNYSEAVSLAGQALDLKPDGKEATQLKADASRDAEYAGAVLDGREALKQGKYEAALQKANVALMLYPNSVPAIQLATEAKAEEQKAATIRDCDQKLQDLQTQLNSLSSTQPDSPGVGGNLQAPNAANWDQLATSLTSLRQTYESEQALDTNRAGILDNLEGLISKQKEIELSRQKPKPVPVAVNKPVPVPVVANPVPAVPAAVTNVAAPAPPVVPLTRADLDAQLEVFKVKYHQMDAKNAKSAIGRATQEDDGQLDIVQKEAVLNQLAALRKGYKDKGWYTSDMDHVFENIEQAIKNYQ